MKHFTCILLFLLLGDLASAQENKKADKPKAESPNLLAAKKAYEAGKYKEAIKLLEVELAAEKKKAKPDETRIGKILTGLASMHNIIGEVHKGKREYAKALEYYHKTQAILLKQLGPDHPLVASSYNNIGLVHDEKGEYDKALEYHQKSLAIWLKQLGPDHPDVASSYNNIGSVYGVKAEYDKALEYYQKSLAIRLKQLGPDHPDVANSYHNIAFVYKAKKDLPKAKEYWEKAYAIYLKNLGPNHPYTKIPKTQLDTLR